MSPLVIFNVLFQVGLKKTQLRPPGGVGGPARQPCARGSVPGASASLGASPAAGRGKAAGALLRPAGHPSETAFQTRLGSAEGSRRLWSEAGGGQRPCPRGACPPGKGSRRGHCRVGGCSCPKGACAGA